MKQLCSLLAIAVLLRSSYCKTKTKCEVVEALRFQGVPDNDLRDWLCLVQHESAYHYDARSKKNSNGSRDHGIFQLNSKYWCNRPQGTSEATCWKLNTYGCDDTCASFRNSDITNDANCAVRIQRCGGFIKWHAWRDRCQDVSGTAYDYSDC